MYHFMYPDDVVSAHHYHDLARGLVERGWEVEALACSRGCRDESVRYAQREYADGVQYRRIWRPRFRQSSFSGRLLNAAWMVLAWARVALRRASRRPDVVLIGTDPVFAVTSAVPLKLFSGRMKIAHWCFDLHPEAAAASSSIDPASPLYRLARAGCAMGYRRCDLVVDIGPGMRERLRRYSHGAAEATITPWALAEPSTEAPVDPASRNELFGDCAMGILYSGNFGEAHEFQRFLLLARSLRDTPQIRFCFAVRGNRANRLQEAVTDGDTNISFAGFAPADQLENRLSAADIHLCSLRAEWSGIAVPSKFFGSLSAGRPVIYDGDSDSDIGGWISRFDVGWVLGDDNIQAVAASLRQLADDPRKLSGLKQNAHQVYREHFAKQAMIEAWDDRLRSTIDGNR
ncbi:glycosyltransferase WbuB [Wenzhouxiangella sp. 15181]|nr:glycosyltransferase WbuB [Wenzhouxiangella sp. 15181]RFP69011.1 glycosyltransferase WbuB [Wenzhouxiangella sp. 15190]